MANFSSHTSSSKTEIILKETLTRTLYLTAYEDEIDGFTFCVEVESNATEKRTELEIKDSKYAHYMDLAEKALDDLYHQEALEEEGFQQDPFDMKDDNLELFGHY